MPTASIVIFALFVTIVIRDFLIYFHYRRARNKSVDCALKFLEKMHDLIPSDTPAEAYKSLFLTADNFLIIYNKHRNTNYALDLITAHKWSYKSMFSKFEEEINNYVLECEELTTTNFMGL